MDFLLTLRMGGYTFRLATRTLNVARDDGSTLAHQGGLHGVDWERSFRLATDAPANDIPIDVGPGVLDIPALLLEGVTVYSATAELARLLEGRTWEQREILVDGRVSELVYDDGAEPVSFTILATEWNASKLVPPYSAVLNYADVPDNVQGAVAPIVFGAPCFRQSSGLYDPGAGSMAHAVETPALNSGAVICAEHVEADTVWLAYDVPVEERRWVSHTVLRGPVASENVLGPHAHVKLSSTLLAYDSSYPGTPDAQLTRFVVAWGGYGVFRPTIGKPVRTAGELIEFLLWRGGNVDRGRTAAAVHHLPIEVDGYIDEQVDPAEWITANLSSILPVSIVTGPDGLYPLVARPYLNPDEEGPELSVARREIFPAGPVVFDSAEDIRNAINVQHRLDAGARTYDNNILHTGDPLEAAGNNVNRSQLATSSRAIFGERPYTVQTAVIGRKRAAHQVASWMVRRYALPTRTTEYALDSILDQKLAAIEPGGPVTITDPARGISGPCVVENIRADLDGVHIISVRTVNK